MSDPIKTKEVKILREFPWMKHVSIENQQFISTQETDEESEHGWFKGVLQNIVSGAIGTGLAERFNHLYPVDFMAKLEPKLIGTIDDDYDISINPFASFFEVLASRKQALVDAFNGRVGRGVLESDDFSLYFTPGMEVFSTDGKHPIGGVIEATHHRRTMMGSYWEIHIKTIVCRMDGPEEVTIAAYEDDWGGTKNISDLEIKIKAEGDMLTLLNERGKKFRAATNGASYMLYSGQIARKTWFGDRHFRGDGRVMVDGKSFKTIDSDGYSSEERRLSITSKPGSRGYPGSGRGREEEKAQPKFSVSDDNLWRCSPYVMGFSFRAKQWGTMEVESISEIQYREDAFDQLVLDPEYKRVIKALVENSGGSYKDVVEGKGGGCIFLLEGEPGQGKTLTAETVAEVLKRPLYPISVGELGTDPDALEARLRKILDIATNWNAVLLLDECDIFLEARDTKDITRNAMVGVLLRLLEYHEGVLFLTTNRADNIDRAFFSRISMALSFPVADEAKRRQVWTNLLTKSGNAALITDENMDKFVKRDINGRQINNGIRLSQTLARSEKREMTAQDIVNTLDIGQVFINKLARNRNIYYRVFDWARRNLIP